ncbi:MAG: archaemetzincin [Panacibacter sp.]
MKKIPGEDDWLAAHKETYQSLSEYVKSNPTGVEGERNKIYIMLVGEFDSTQKEIVYETAKYLQAFYGLEVVDIKIKTGADIYGNSRHHPSQGQLQLSAKQIMNFVLTPQLPKDAATLIAFTNYDLYPGNDWNFIFGLGSMKERVGIWSMYRFGDPHKVADKEQCLMLTIKTATHEIGHMFSLPHCVKFECCMNGSNTLRELNSHPTYFCPDCLAKICWNLKQDVKTNLNRIQNYWIQSGDTLMAEVYTKSLKQL